MVMLIKINLEFDRVSGSKGQVNSKVALFAVYVLLVAHTAHSTNPEYGNSTILCNTGELLLDCTVTNPRSQ
jgi:hypothetical protein